ncbi:MAG: CAP domain-containing protein [Acidobacteriota bacterium]|nr:CAP domain-containing protein [Acidobacteriota bacterium]
MKTLLVALLLSVAALPALAQDASNEITAENVIRIMNDYRAQEALPPLAADARLTLAAGDRMQNMEEEGYWSHTSPDGMSPFTWVKVRAYDFKVVGENLATGFETAKVLVESWMESPGHRANIMGAEFTDCGIAIIEGSTKGPADGKSIVVLFGRKQDPGNVVVRKR